ncbi:MAG: hypothetical protein ABSF67_12985 [Roseiarcus sp.]
MSKRTKTMSVRIDARSYEFARAYALSREMSIADALAAIVAAAEEANPIEIFVRHCVAADGDFFTATIGNGFADFYSGNCKERAERAVPGFLRANGLDPRRFKIVHETQDFRLSPHGYEDGSKSA